MNISRGGACCVGSDMGESVEFRIYVLSVATVLNHVEIIKWIKTHFLPFRSLAVRCI